MEKRLGENDFDRHLRESLRYGHGFTHEELEEAKEFVTDAVSFAQKHGDTKRGMGAQHFDRTMQYLREERKDWIKLPEHKRAAIEQTLKNHLGVKEEGED